MKPITKSVTINDESIRRTKGVLIDNGIDPDEAEDVVQAIGYTLIDTELFPNKIDLTSPETVGAFIDIFDDFLEDENVRIPSSDKELKASGEWNDDGQNRARIYGSTYDRLANKVLTLLRGIEQNINSNT